MEQIVSMWGEHGPRPDPLSANADAFAEWSVSESILVNCGLDSAWALVTDVTRIGEFSPECESVRWILGSKAALGNRFAGTNRAAIASAGTQYEFIWTRPCTITECEHNVFSYSVGDRYDGTPATVWEYRLELTPAGLRIDQTFQHLRDGLSGIRVQADADPTRTREIISERTAGIAKGMRETLEAMKAILELAGNS